MKLINTVVFSSCTDVVSVIVLVFKCTVYRILTATLQECSLCAHAQLIICTHLVGNNQQTPACILILLRKPDTEFHYFQLLGSFINSLRQ